MPSHSSHIIQPLDAACFSLLKSAYGKLVLQLARDGIFHVDKTDFLRMYKQARQAIHSEQNTISGFRATGLIPFNPERILSSLTITKTPSPPSSSHGHSSSPWISETPKNPAQINKTDAASSNCVRAATTEPNRAYGKSSLERFNSMEYGCFTSTGNSKATSIK
jgi:DDE superfamily endonuclease